MPWNEPGKNSNDPWGGGGGGGGGRGGGTGGGPPDLDELIKKLSGRFGGLFGGGGGGGDGGGMGRHASAGISLILIVAVVVWLASGFYIISEGERGVVLRFGAFQTVTEPGPNWHLPYPIERVERVDIGSVRSVRHRALMLTADENIIDVDVEVQYRVSDPEAFLFNVRDPERTVRQVMESAIRERVAMEPVVVRQRMMEDPTATAPGMERDVIEPREGDVLLAADFAPLGAVGHEWNDLEFILGEGRGQIAQSSRVVIQEAVDDYGAGILLTGVNLPQAQPPEAVQEAFADAIRAREDQIRFRNEAQAYANGIVPQARGEAARIREEAEAYREQVLARAEGDSARFTQLLVEYQRAPDVTRERLYLETAEAVLGGTNKVIVDMKSGNNLMYLPLDKFMQQAPGTPITPRASGDMRGVDSRPQPLPGIGQRPDPRTREVR